MNTDKPQTTSYHQQDGSLHEHKLCNHCSVCKTPLLASYCIEHEPRWTIYWIKRLGMVATKIKFFFVGWEES